MFAPVVCSRDWQLVQVVAAADPPDDDVDEQDDSGAPDADDEGLDPDDALVTP